MSDFFDTTEVLNILRGFNPWWARRQPVIPEFRRLAYGVCRRYLERTQRAVLLSGPRRVGKTTILLQLGHDLASERLPESILYLSLDHPLLKLLTIPQILRIYHDHIHPREKAALLLLDEVQYSREWEFELKQLIDHRPEYRILATGSASVVHQQALGEAGVGRWIKVPIPTLSLYEFMRIRGEDVSGIAASLRPSELFDMEPHQLAEVAAPFARMLPSFLTYLLVGGFPETARQRDISLSQRLIREDVVERVLKRDMTALFGIRNVHDLEKLFIYICLHSGSVFSVQTCASALGASTATVSSHLAALEQANLIYRVAPFRLGGKKVLRAKYKVYLVDAALRNAVLLRGDEMLADPTELGTTVETTVLRHLYAYYYRDTPEILYWRKPRSEQEVDVIVRSPAYLIPVEVKYRNSAALTADEGICVFAREEAPEKAYWVTKRQEDFNVLTFPGIKTRFLRVPAHVFIYLLGQAERHLWT